ncbi:MAG TPA: hypothetical protein VNG51_06405 [Ktedonobacteraceae bacterium]|nr:hypothetical protein [Ktedonobacteraceae bacterium]
MKRTIPTTTLKVVKPEDYSALGATFPRHTQRGGVTKMGSG